MSYSNINNPVNYQLQGFGQNGVRTISTDQLYIQGEYYRVLVAEEDSYVTAVSVLGDDLTAEFVYAGTTIYGLFTEVSVSSGSLTAYIAGPTDIEDVWAYINAYGQTNAATIEAADCAKDAIAPLLDKYYAKASLVMVPSLYKTSIVYSERPLTTDGQLAFTRSNDTATRVGPNGLIENVRTNLVLQSQAFENASWIKINATATANSTTAPDGTLTADTILAPLASATAAYQGISSQGAMTLSLYAKANTSNFISLTIFDVSPAVDYTAIFDLSNGTFIGNGGLSSVDSYSIENAGNGWYRLSVTKNVGAVGTHNYVVGVAKTGNSPVPVAGTSVFVWGAQVEASDFGPTPYIATTSAAVSVGPVANVPRLDYLNSSCPRLLLEPQRTNLALYSESFDNAYWTKNRTTITANTSATLDPSGTNGADKIVETATTLFHGIERAFGTLSGSHSLSVFAKAAERNWVYLEFFTGATSFTSFFDLSNGTIGTSAAGNNAKIENYGNGWYRLSISRAAGSGTSFFVAGLATADNTPSYTGDGTSGAYFYGAQLEAGAYATSYIPTLGAAVTRGADACSKTGISSLIGQTEGTLFVEMNINKRVDLGSSGPNGLEIKDASGSNVIMIGTVYGVNQTFNLGLRNAGSFSTLFSTTNNALGTYKLAAAYSSAGFVFYLNGVQIGTSATLPPSATFADMGLMQVFGTNNPQGELVNQAILFPTRLTNQELQDLTTL